MVFSPFSSFPKTMPLTVGPSQEKEALRASRSQKTPHARGHSRARKETNVAQILHAGYRGGSNNPPNPRLPNIHPGETIPNHLRSQHADTNQTSKIGVGPLNAIVELLSGRATIWREGDDIRVDYLSSGKSREVRQSHSRQGNMHRSWKNAEGRTGPYLLGLIESALLGVRPETQQIYSGLLDHINNTLKISLPVRDDTDWRRINNDQRANELIVHLTDSLYYTLKGAFERGEIDTDDTIPPVAGRAVPLTDLGLKHVPGAANAPTTSRRARGKRIGLEPLARLVRLATSGGTALLTGPTGTFKTETGKQLALTTKARLVTLKGAAGIEDRDFWGSIVPTEQGPKWVDGPLTRAFRLAQKSKTVLLIDELLRFEPLYANVLVGALDTVNPTELKAMGEEPLGAGAHFCVTLPSGEVIPAPKENLTIVATTNQGDDYEQFGAIDAALLGRFELQVDMSTADPNILKRIYTEVFGNDSVITKLLDFERWTRGNTGVHGGLLKRPTNPRVTINLLREAKRLIDEGLGQQPALNAAFEVTVMPYCAPRDTTGALAEDACAILRDEFKNVARAQERRERP